MDFDGWKENIQPLASGRNATILQASLMESTQELLAQRRELEKAIQQYSGDDPLEAWYAYIDWIEQSYPSGGKESGLEEVLTKCLSRFESESKYYQDRRMVKLYIKFIDSHKNPTECYQQLFNAGIGTMIADLYICWAYYYDLSGNYRKAEEIFRRGLDCRAQPFEELQEAHQHFGFTVAQRLLYKDDKDVCQTATQQLQDRRMALTSLRGHKRKATVGSIRTGAAVKNALPGTVKSDQSALSNTRHRNARVEVLDENSSPNVGPPDDAAAAAPAKLQLDNNQPETVVRAIIDAARNQENQIEPGPWNKAHGHKKNAAKLFGKSVKTNELAFNIHVDDPDNDNDRDSDRDVFEPITGCESNYDKPFKYPVGFKVKNRPQTEYNTPVTIENESNPRAYPEYNKMMLYPRPNVEMQLEELRAYNWFKRRGITNAFTTKRDAVWGNGVQANMRQYPNFAKHSRPQAPNPLDDYYEPEKPKNLRADFKRLYDAKKREEFSFEELMLRGLRRYDTICEEADMEETVCMPSERIQRRKSFYPAAMRRSMAAKSMGGGRVSLLPSDEPKRCDVPQTAEEPPKKPALSILKQLQTLDEVEEVSATATSATAAEQQQHEKSVNDIAGQVRRLNFVAEMDDTTQKEEVHTLATTADKTTQDTVPEVACGLPFEIYEDPTVTKIITVPVRANIDKSPILQTENEGFQFKAPTLPKTSAPRVPFEIFSESLSPPQASAAAAPSNPSAAGLFDADETCSTQKFNIFLKSQFVSTPKMCQKVAPRQFAGVLKDIPPITLSPKSPPESEGVLTTPPAQIGNAAFSPTNQLKQLSTILETSEHGTTQGTTQGSGGGGSAKLAISSSSPEYDTGEVGALGSVCKVGARIIHQHGEQMETLQEQSREVSSKLENLMESMHVQEGVSEKHDPSRNRDSLSEPSAGRLVGDPLMAFPLCDDGAEPLTKVGNFSRLEAPEDTGNVLPFMVRPARFQEDKTETVPKMLLHIGETLKFQDDKTETISKMMLHAPGAAMPVRFEEDNAGTEHTASKIPIKPPSSLDTGWDDDMDFFCKTPPKLGKSVVAVRKDLDMFDSPLMGAAGAKRFCDKNTPKVLAGHTQAIFEDELPQMAKSKFTDSLLPMLDDADLSMVLGTQPVAANPPKVFMKATQQVSASNNTRTVTENDVSTVLCSQAPMEASATGRLLASAKSVAKQSHIKDALDAMLMNDSDLSMVMGTQAPPAARQEHVAPAIKMEPNIQDSYMAAFGLDTKPQTGKDTTMPKQPAPPAPTNLSFLSNASIKFKTSADNEPQRTSPKKVESHEPYFELNAATEMFATNISMIRNSTLLTKPQPQQYIQNESLHRKMEMPSPTAGKHMGDLSFGVFKSPPPPVNKAEKPKHSMRVGDMSITRTETVPSEASARKSSQLPAEKSSTEKRPSNVGDADDEFGEMSIYYKTTPQTPHLRKHLHLWENDFKTPPRTDYVHQEVNLNQTYQMIEHLCDDPNVNPFNADLISAFLDQIDFTNYIKELRTCQMVGRVRLLDSSESISVNGVEFVGPKLIGEGAYGAVYCAVEAKSRRKYALKQERPPNNWEYYICLEVHSRLQNMDISPSFMKIEYALVGNNSSVLISPFYQHGSLISVCNKIKRYTNKNVDEYVVMHLTCELLDIIDNLHAINIIHADIKADNIILMEKLSYPSEGNVLHLIDFGVSIDMKLFKSNQSFNYVHNDYAFKCVEMREKRPWSYQLDLCGLASVIHVLLFGKHMDIEKRNTGAWMPKTRFPRYFNKMLWENIFKQLLNIPNAKTMPNLQELRSELKEEIAHKEKYLHDKILEFNRGLCS